MNKGQLAAKIQYLQDLEVLITQAQEEAEAVRDAIKSCMGDREELRAGGRRVTWRTVRGRRFDANALRRAMPDTYSAFTRETIGRRFRIEE